MSAAWWSFWRRITCHLSFCQAIFYCARLLPLCQASQPLRHTVEAAGVGVIFMVVGIHCLV